MATQWGDPCPRHGAEVSARPVGPCFDWDGLIESGETTTESLRDRDFPAWPDAFRDLVAYYRRERGPTMPVYAVIDGDAVPYWSTHEPSAREYVRQRGGEIVPMIPARAERASPPSRSMNLENAP